MRVLGIDTALRCTGLGVVEKQGTRLICIEYGLIRNPASLSRSECLRRLHGGVLEFLERTKPDEVAIESSFYARNVRTAMVLGEARGAVLAGLASASRPIFEHAPRRVKQAVVGFGAAQKDQVGRMVMRLLTLSTQPPEDAADALALAICHIQSRGPASLAPQKPL